jgi:predicted small secreted protein
LKFLDSGDWRNLRYPYKIHLQSRKIGLSKTSMKAILLITAAAAAMLFTSCNTMIGLGRDMRMGGEGLESSANKVTGGGSSSGAADTGGAPVY